MQENDSFREDYMIFFFRQINYVKGFICKDIIGKFKVGNQKYEQATCEDRREEKTNYSLVAS